MPTGLTPAKEVGRCILCYSDHFQNRKEWIPSFSLLRDVKMWRYFSKASLILLLASSSAYASKIEIRNSIPEKFWGNWASKAENCGKNHVQNLRIGPTSLEFSESSGIPVSIVLKDQKELALIVDFTGEGDHWIGFVHFEISEDGSSLADIKNTYAGNGFARIKCK